MASDAPPGPGFLCQTGAVFRLAPGVRPWFAVAAFAVGGVGFAARARAAEAGDDGPPAPATRTGKTDPLGPFAGFGVEHAAALLQSVQPSERLRGFRRLAGLGTVGALRRLTQFALAHRADLDARDRLIVARLLASHAEEADSQALLAVLLNQEPAQPGGPEQAALFEAARGTAALALAVGGTPAALGVLAAALRTGGPAARWAAEALRAHPPRDLAPLLDAPREPSVELARLLGDLGDQRAFYTLRAWVRGGSVEVRAAAAVALTQLGELETVPLARRWVGSEEPALRHAALDILRRVQAPEAAALLVERLATPDGASAAALEQLLEFPAPDLPLETLDRLAQAPDSAALWTLLGRIGGEPAAHRLETALRRPESAFAAAQALSRLPGAAGEAALARLITAGVALPLTTRAAALRSALWHEHFDGLEARIAGLLASDLPGDRAAGAWASALGSPLAALAELASEDPVRREAAANAGLWLDDAVFESAARRLAQSAPGRARDALAFALSRPSGSAHVTSQLLRELVTGRSVGAPLALRALAARNDPDSAAFAEAFVEDPDPVLRSHVARGLGESGRPAALGRLARQYEFETDETVRLAIVRALSGHAGRTLQRTLDLAAGLDPSAKVRSAARLAQGGVVLADPPAGAECLWVALLPAIAEPGIRAAGASAGLLRVAPGLAIPVFADPAGLLVVAGVDLEPLDLRWQ